MIPSAFTALAVGLQGLTSVGQGYLLYIISSLTTVGSLILTGNIYLISELVTTPAIYLNNQAAITLQADGDVEFGSGDLVFDQTRNGASNGAMCTKTKGGNFIECYQEDVFTSTGGKAAALAVYYDVASIANPYGTATGSITQWGLDCDGQPVQTVASVGTVAALTASSSSLVARSAIQTGSMIMYAPNSSSGVTFKWPPSQYVKVSTSARVAHTAGSSQCVLRVWSYGQYNP